MAATPILVSAYHYDPPSTTANGRALQHDVALLEMQKPPPHYDEDGDGALRNGGSVNLFNPSYIGILVNYAAIGFIMGTLPSSVLPFLKNYLHMKSYQASSALKLIAIASSLKSIIGIVSDSFPIMGYRRRPYMILGWIMCSFSLCAASFFPVPKPYYYPGTTMVQNHDAPAAGAKFTIAMMLAGIAYTFAEVATDAMMIELAQREPVAVRGRTQMIAHVTRMFFSTLARIYVGSVLNGQSYGGTFEWSLSFSAILLTLGCISLIPIAGVICFLTEEKTPRENFVQRFRAMWRLLQRLSMWQVLLFEFIAEFCWSFSSSASLSVEVTWGKVRPFEKAIIGAFQSIFYMVFAVIGYKYLLTASWKRTFVVTTIWLLAVDMAVTFVTVYDVVRNEYFWLFMRCLVGPATALRYLVTIYPIVEIAEAGYEGVTIGLVTTFMNAPDGFSTAIYKAVDSYFDVTDADIALDSQHVRNDVAATYMIAYAFRALSLVAVFFLPDQRAAALRLRFYGGLSKFFGALMFCMFVVSVSFGTSVNLLAMFKSTSCLRIAGGSGC